MKHQILIIDDLKFIFKNIQTVLEPRGCEVSYCSDGESGIIQAKTKLYDLIILDIHLPDINGIEVCKTLKSIPQYRIRPILLLTSDTQSLEVGLMTGAADYILKPFKDVELIARIFTQINLSKERISSITENESLALNLENKRLKLMETQNDLHQYFYQTSHKLRSPLNSMEGIIQLLKIEYPELKDNNYIQLLQKTLDKLAYVNQQISKIGEFKTRSSIHKKFQLHSCLQYFLSRNFPDFIFNLNVTSDPYLYTDLRFFLSGLKPIIENAVYYSGLSKQTNEIEVSLVLKEIKEETYLIIRNNGSGICDEQLQKIFDLFHIGNDKSSGNGLGLFISKTAFEKIEMNLSIESIEDEYTEVKINLQTAINRLNYTDKAIRNTE